MTNFTFNDHPEVTEDFKRVWNKLDPITDEHKAIYYHIPKCGGSSMKRFCENENSIVYAGHRRVRHTPIEIIDRRLFKFTFTRNPYDRLVSAYSYLVNGFGNEHDVEYGKKLSPDFNYFVKKQLPDIMKNSWWDFIHFIPMSFYIDEKVNFVGRLENYQQDLNHVCNVIGIPTQQLTHNNKSKHKHYTEYYDGESRSIVREIYREDFEKFKYEWLQ